MVRLKQALILGAAAVLLLAMVVTSLSTGVSQELYEGYRPPADYAAKTTEGFPESRWS